MTHDKAYRRRARYLYRELKARGQFRYCSARLWMFRRWATRRGLGPRQLRGKTAGQLFELLL